MISLELFSLAVFSLDVFSLDLISLDLFSLDLISTFCDLRPNSNSEPEPSTGLCVFE